MSQACEKHDETRVAAGRLCDGVVIGDVHYPLGPVGDTIPRFREYGLARGQRSRVVRPVKQSTAAEQRARLAWTPGLVRATSQFGGVDDQRRRRVAKPRGLRYLAVRCARTEECGETERRENASAAGWCCIARSLVLVRECCEIRWILYWMTSGRILENENRRV